MAEALAWLSTSRSPGCVEEGAVGMDDDEPSRGSMRPNTTFLSRMMHGVARGNQRVIDVNASRAAQKVRAGVKVEISGAQSYSTTISMSAIERGCSYHRGGDGPGAVMCTAWRFRAHTAGRGGIWRSFASACPVASPEAWASHDSQGSAVSSCTAEAGALHIAHERGVSRRTSRSPQIRQGRAQMGDLKPLARPM